MTNITRLFDSHTEALAAVTDLENAGVAHDRISIVANNTDNWHAGHTHPDKGAERSLGNRNGDGENSIATGAGTGAATGGALGAGAGVLAGLGMLAIPGLGPVVAVGWLASTAVGAAIGAAAGVAAGGLLGALKEAGHSEEDANVYAEGVRRGGTLISVKTDNHDDKDRINAILDAQRGWDAGLRGQAYRDAGWSRFDPEAAPYSSAEITRERAKYR